MRPEASSSTTSPLRFLLFPRVAKTDGSVEHRCPGLRVQVRDEIPGSLELIPGAGGVAQHTRLDLRAFYYDERVGIQRIHEVPALRHRIRIGNPEQPVVDPELAIDRVWRRDPVNGALDLPAVRGVSAAGRGVV